MSRLFIVYRQSDSGFLARQIADRLAGVFGASSLVTIAQDATSNPRVRDETIMLANSSALVMVLIGQQFAADARLQQSGDLVRMALEVAVNNANVPVLPVLVGGALMPNAQLLPPTIQALCYRGMSSVRDLPYFEQDIQNLIIAVQRMVSIAAAPPAAPVPVPSPRRVESPEQPIVLVRTSGNAGMAGCMMLPFRLVGQFLGFIASLFGVVIRVMLSSVLSFVMGFVLLVVFGGLLALFGAAMFQSDMNVGVALNQMSAQIGAALQGLIGR